MRTGINVKTSFFPLAWILLFCKPVIEINGHKIKKSWGTSFFDLQPGEYHVKIYFAYVFKPECGANSINVSLRPGEVRNISFYMPPWMFSKGSMKIS
jgi:hypothetical protein